MRALLHRLRELPPRKLDALIAGFVLVEGLAEALLWMTLDGVRQAIGISVIVAFAVAVLLRRRPFVAIPIAFAALTTGDALGPEMTNHMAGPFFSTLLVTYTAGTVLEGRRLAIAAAMAAVGLVTALTVDQVSNSVGNLIFSLTFVVGAPILFGQLTVNRSRLNAALRDKAAHAEAQRREEAASAALEERTRIAGELHDVVAHALSAMTVQAAGARRLSTKDPERAREAFATVEATGREALTELRRLLGVLRKEDEELALAPQPSLAHVDALAQRWRAAGLPVDLEVTGTVRALPAGVDLTAYRLVQEALGGARDAGAAGRARVRIEYGGETVHVDVADDGAPGERGLPGMRERVSVYGGELESAPADGGWRVSARLPVEVPA